MTKLIILAVTILVADLSIASEVECVYRDKKTDQHAFPRMKPDEGKNYTIWSRASFGGLTFEYVTGRGQSFINVSNKKTGEFEASAESNSNEPLTIQYKGIAVWCSFNEETIENTSEETYEFQMDHDNEASTENEETENLVEIHRGEQVEESPKSKSDGDAGLEIRLPKSKQPKSSDDGGKKVPHTLN